MRPDTFLALFARPLMLAGLLCATALAWSQTGAPTVSEADIAKARRNQPVITDADVERARNANRMPTDAELSRVPVPSTPNIDALPQPVTRGSIDLGAIAQGYEAAVRDSVAQGGLGAGPGLLVFVSFTMPEKTLTRLVDQAARAKATLVLRGLVNGSLQETVARVQKLMDGRKVAFQIDPQAFERFGVAAAPTFVLVRDGARPADCAAGSCFASDAFVAVAGDVSLDYALEHFQRWAPRFTRDAAGFLKRLRG